MALPVRRFSISNGRFLYALDQCERERREQGRQMNTNGSSFISLILGQSWEKNFDHTRAHGCSVYLGFVPKVGLNVVQSGFNPSLTLDFPPLDTTSRPMYG